MQHVPAMAEEVCRFMLTQTDGTYVDCTLGDGGHTEILLKQGGSNAQLLCMDRDIEAIESSKKRLRPFEERVQYFHDNYTEIRHFLQEVGVDKADGILFDLGVSNRQLMDGDRGFSFKRNGPLDMRMDQRLTVSAADIVNTFSLEEIKKTIRDFGEERFAGRVAYRIVKEREKGRITTTEHLAQIIRSAVPTIHGKKKSDPATRSFQGLRIAVNNELSSVELALRESVDLLKKGGRLCVITYHSLEEQIVKAVFNEYKTGCTCPPRIPICVCGKKASLRVLTRKPVYPSEDEVQSNPKVRSAKLRIAERL